ncbi:MAG TPA: helix-turn-helix transcriptional regulator [Anaerolineales bacterium]|nr:helix-turn-helix transcriptional regulator [Anaerolineales bacterium]
MVNNNEPTETLDKISQELRRGVLILATLSQLREEKYGYDLISHLAEQGLDIDQGTLYPLLRRLESQGLLASLWNVDGSRPRKYYKLNAAGEAMLTDLTREWRALTEVMERLLTQ